MESTTTPTRRGRLMVVAEVAHELGEPRQRIYQWIAAGRLPAIRVGRAIRVSGAQLDAWIDAGGTAADDGAE